MLNMSDSEDADLENLRQAALSSLLKKKSVPLQVQTNAVFYRPVSNSNLISIQPVAEIDEQDEESEDSDSASSSGSEYAVIEEGLSVSSGDVDQVIEEIIVSEEEDNESEEAEDAVSIASHDSFDEILNSVEEEIRGAKKRTARVAHANDSSGPNDIKRLRSDVSGAQSRSSTSERRLGSKSPSRDSSNRETNKSSRQGNRRPISPPRSPNHYRNRRSKSPRNRRTISPIDRKTSKSPTENMKPRSISASRRRSTSPGINRRRQGNTGRGFSHVPRPPWKDEYRRPRSRNSRSRSMSGGSDNTKLTSKFNKSDDGRRPSNQRRLNDDRKSRSRSPRNKLSFGDHRLRSRAEERLFSRNSSRQRSQEKTRSPGTKRREKSKSPDRKRSTKTRTPSPTIDMSNLTEEERLKLEKRKLKFQSKVSHSGKVILKPKENRTQNSEEETKVQIPHPNPKSSSLKEKRSTENPKPKITSRLGHMLEEEEQLLRRRRVDRSKSKSVEGKSRPRRRDVNEVEDSSKNKSSRPTTESSSRAIGQDDLRTKLQQKRAANVGRIFSAALKDTLHKDSALRSSTSPRS